MQPESDFTEPRPDCPHPEWWTATDDQSCELEVSDFLAAFVRLLQPEIVVETGTAHGNTAETIGQALKKNGHGHLYTIEIDKALVDKAIHRLLGLPVTVIQGSTLDYPPPGPVDLAWIDSDPYIRLNEIEHFNPKFWLLHDTGPHFPWSDRLHGVKGIYIPTPRGLTIGCS